MSHLSWSQIWERQTRARDHIVQQWEQVQGFEWYWLKCNCVSGCNCVGEEEVPRLTLQECLYPGELDLMVVEQPFVQELGFNIS